MPTQPRMLTQQITLAFIVAIDDNSFILEVKKYNIIYDTKDVFYKDTVRTTTNKESGTNYLTWGWRDKPLEVDQRCHKERAN